ncbi:MAG: hypothetical protein MK171_08115 [Pirellulales bacterium]|nr:hypothetical protein [Pirellulales bacterium]
MMVESTAPLLRRSAVNHLRGLLEGLDPGSQNLGSSPKKKWSYLSSGCPDLDRVLPGGGIRTGSLIEWLGDGPGSGVSLLPLTMVRAVQENGGMVVIVDRQGTGCQGKGRQGKGHRSNFYPPAAAAWGIDLENIVVVHPDNDADQLWAIDQALRCADVATVMAWPNHIDSHTFRRWQLAAESSGTVGLFVRPSHVQGEPTWANLRLLVSPLTVSSKTTVTPKSTLLLSSSQNALPFHRGPLPGKLPSFFWRWRVKVLRCRGLWRDWEVELEVDQRTGEIYEASVGNLASRLATATPGEQTA